MHKLLKFRYFLTFLILFSCGESAQKKTNAKVEVEVEVEDSKQTESTVDFDGKTILFFGDSLTAGMYGYQLWVEW